MLTFRSNKYIETAQNGLIILSINEGDAGLYDCLMGPSLLCSYNITVDSSRCTPPGKAKDYKKVYSDWCYEFERYKYSMKMWEQKQNVGNILNFNKNLNINERLNCFFFRNVLLHVMKLIIIYIQMKYIGLLKV